MAKKKKLQDRRAHFTQDVDDIKILNEDSLSRHSLTLDDDLPFICAISSELIVSRDDPNPNRVLDAIDEDD
jgi:hypothetical protein